MQDFPDRNCKHLTLFRKMPPPPQLLIIASFRVTQHLSAQTDTYVNTKFYTHLLSCLACSFKLSQNLARSLPSYVTTCKRILNLFSVSYKIVLIGKNTKLFHNCCNTRLSRAGFIGNNSPGMKT